MPLPPPVRITDGRHAGRVLSASNGCSDHRRYEVKRKPSGDCETCWALWLKKKGKI